MDKDAGAPDLRFDESPRTCRIVGTLGPASERPEIIEGLILAGLNIARLNFSHGTHESHGAIVGRIRESSRRLCRSVAVLQDLQGHKVRIGRVRDSEAVTVVDGDEVLLGHGTDVTAKRIGLDYENIAIHVDSGHRLFVDDAQIELEVLDKHGDDILCRVLMGGQLKSRKGVIFPDSRLDFPLINEKDLRDARFGVDLGVDMVAMSFVRSAAEIHEMRGHLASWGEESAVLIAKIEDREGVESLDEILDAADGVLVARGDLGVTLPREQVPGLQKAIIRSANAVGVPVITATQMLESMTHRDKPTRAEVNDVYCAVIDGSDAVMLSGETATGDYPLRTVEEMDRICREAQRELGKARGEYHSPISGSDTLHDTMAASAATLAQNMNARCILAFSVSGATLRALSSARTGVPVYGAVVDERVLRRLLLHCGLSLVTAPRTDDLDPLITTQIAKLKTDGAAAAGDRVVVIASRQDPGTRQSHHLQLAILD